LIALQSALQTRKSLLRVRKIPGLQRADQALIGRVGLTVIAKRGIRSVLSISLQVLLKRGQSRLRRRGIAGSQRAADGIEIVDNLVKPNPT